jgi:hypothetical protein
MPPSHALTVTDMFSRAGFLIGGNQGLGFFFVDFGIFVESQT